MLCTDVEFIPKNKLMSKVVVSLRKFNHNVSVVDFWKYEPLSKFDLWLLDNGITQEYLSELSSISETSIKKVRSQSQITEAKYKSTVIPIIKSLNELGYLLEVNDLWVIENTQVLIESEFLIESDTELNLFELWLIENELNYTEFARLCGLSTATIKTISKDSKYLPSGGSIKKIMTAAKIIDPNVNISTFGDLNI